MRILLASMILAVSISACTKPIIGNVNQCKIDKYLASVASGMFKGCHRYN